MDPLELLDERIAGATPAERAALVVELSARMARLGAGLVPGPAPVADRRLDVEETARRMGVSERYLYRHAQRLGFAVREGRRLLFSEAGLARYLERRR